jgi:uncharacterized protein (TIGR02145 family)
MKFFSGVCALILLVLFIHSCRNDKKDPPVVATSEVTEITFTSALAGGEIISDGGDDINERGVCYSTSEQPTIKDNIIIDGGLTGTYQCSLIQLLPDTKYYVRAYATNSAGTGYGTQVFFRTAVAGVPELTTAELSSIGQKTAVSGGTITAENGSSIVARGVCWSISPGPTVYDGKSSSGTGSGTFEGLLTALEVNTTYYVRAWASNRTGTGYGNEISFTTIDYGLLADADGNIYRTVISGSQVWMVENLKTTKYSNGDPIPNVITDDDWSLLSEGAYCWYDNSEVPNRALYGALYNWFTVADNRGLCPTGWHVPFDSDWNTFISFLTDNNYAYGGSGDDIAKAMSFTSGWTENTTAGTIGNNQLANNGSGFAALPGGVRIKSGPFAVKEYTASFWSATAHSYTYGNAFTLSGEFFDIFRGYTFKQDGASVRCVQNN